MEEQMFALDIGTRSVVGLLMQKNGEKYKVIDFETIEHEERSMLDGQIHDVVSVANVIARVKARLETKHDIALKKVCVAAAGRALKTMRIHTDKDISKQPLMNKEDILFLELEGVQKAQYQLAKEEEKEVTGNYYCVGYSVIKYLLDKEEIGSLIDQQGSIAAVEIIATFLPKVVVESLLSALHRANLELEALTLEPIAAIHVLIPPSMRRLNVALVDIGAGTSDIALTAEGTVTAYGMVPRAGDEITEAISDHYLLDFNLAESFKKEISIKHVAMVEDILGFEQEIDVKELVDAILPAIDRLADAIAEEIYQLNGTAPKAVMLVGGGSQTPELALRLANRLNLPANRVAIRGVDAIQMLEKSGNLPIGPEFITPIGIAIAAKQNPVHYISVKVNNRMIRLFEMKQLTVGDCLIAAGVNTQKLYGRPGMAYMVNYNGKDITLPGSFGKAPELTLNDKEAKLDDLITNGDKITVDKGENGEAPSITLGEFIGELPFSTITFNNKTYSLSNTMTVNEKTVNQDYVLQDNDKIIFHQSSTVEAFLEKENAKIDYMNQDFFIHLDKKPLVMQEYSNLILLNGRKAKLSDPLKHGDRLELRKADNPRVSDVLKKCNIEENSVIKIFYNGRPLLLTKPKFVVKRDKEVLKADAVVRVHDNLELEALEENPFVFQDIFRFISLDLSKIKGKVEMKRNDKKVTFFDVLEENDSITITWEE